MTSPFLCSFLMVHLFMIYISLFLSLIKLVTNLEVTFLMSVLSCLTRVLCFILVLIFFICFIGTTGIVDYTSYDDMKYAVSPSEHLFPWQIGLAHVYYWYEHEEVYCFYADKETRWFWVPKCFFAGIYTRMSSPLMIQGVWFFLCIQQVKDYILLLTVYLTG